MNIFLRADASASAGFGHVTRSLALGAEFLRRGCSVTLISDELDEFLVQRATRLNIVYELLRRPAGKQEDANQILSHPADVIVVDGYHFSPEFFGALDAVGAKYVVIDDNAETSATQPLLVVNQNPHSDVSMYPTVSAQRVLAGVNYALIRDEVLACRDIDNGEPASLQRSVLVAIGGTDVRGLNQPITQALTQVPGLTVCSASKKLTPSVVQAPADIAESLASATVAVIGAGTTMWEACAVGTPFVAVIVADNQVGAACAAGAAGVCRVVDARTTNGIDEVLQQATKLLEDSEAQRSMATRGRELVDGAGAQRVVSALYELMGTQ